MSEYHFTYHTLEPRPPSQKPSVETTSEPETDTPSYFTSPTKKFYIKYMSPAEIVSYCKGVDVRRFSTLEERTKESPRGYTLKIRILDQEETLEAVEDIITPTKIPSQLTTNF